MAAIDYLTARKFFNASRHLLPIAANLMSTHPKAGSVRSIQGFCSA